MGKKIEIDVVVDSSKAVQGVDKLGKSTDKLGASTDKLDKSSKKTSKGLDGMSGAAGAAVAGFKAMAKSALAFIATPIGAVLAVVAGAVLAVKTAFTSSEAGQNKYNKIMGVLGSILGNLTDVISDFGEALIDMFSNPMESLNSFANAFKKNIVNRFNGLLELIPQLGKSISALFEGNFAEAGQIAADAVAKVALGVENITAKVIEATIATGKMFAEFEKDAATAAKIADKRAKADKLERDLIVQRAKADRKIIELREIASRRDLYTSDQRKQALEDALIVNEKIINQEIVAAQLRASAITKENTLSKSNKEALKEEQVAKALVIQLETKKLNLQKRLGTELAALNLELAAKELKAAKDKEKLEKEKEELDIEAKLLKDEKKLEDDEKEKVRKDRIAEEDKQRIEDEIEAERIAARTKANIQKQYLDSISGGIKLLAGLAGESKAAQAAGIIAENAAGIAKMIISNNIANTGALATPQAIATSGTSAIPVIAANNIQTGVNVGMSIAATVKGLAALKKGGSAGSKPSFGSGGSASASAPELNKETLFSSQNLQGAETEKVGESAGINQIKAIVVESDITNIQNKISDLESASEIG